MVDWRHAIEKEWPELRFGEVTVETNGSEHMFEAQVYLNGLDPNAARFEMFANGVDGAGPARHGKERIRPISGAAGGYVYRAAVSAARPAADYTVRALPHFDGVAVPLETAQILWQR